MLVTEFPLQASRLETPGRVDDRDVNQPQGERTFDRLPAFAAGSCCRSVTAKPAVAYPAPLVEKGDTIDTADIAATRVWRRTSGTAVMSRIRTAQLSLPATRETLAQLDLGTVVYLTGRVFTAREGVYKRAVEDGHGLPVAAAQMGSANFHCSPAASIDAAGRPTVGAVTATASFRFAKWLDGWFKLSGCTVIIGKGGMTSEIYRRSFVPAGAIYLTTVGYGTGALLGRGIRRVAAVHWLEELGLAQAVWVLEVENFGPFLVESDLAGNSLFERENAKIAPNLEQIYAGTRPATLRRFGETDDKTDELI
jgi:L(+)-tartrate dehydratase beta subunit